MTENAPLPVSSTASSAHFSPNGVITLTTDFGVTDPFVGIMKGVILARLPTAKLVDLTHEVPAYQAHIAGFWLARSWAYFPAGTVHLAVVDPGVGTSRAIMLLRAGEQLFVAPDNGLLDAMAEQMNDVQQWRVQLSELAEVSLPVISKTFHGRDVFAPLVAEIAAGRLPLHLLGMELRRAGTTQALAVSSKVSGSLGQIAGKVLLADHFGNLLTDIEAAAITHFVRPEVSFRGQAIVLKETYGDSKPGEITAVINAFGVIELCQTQGNAQRHFSATAGEAVIVRDAK